MNVLVIMADVITIQCAPTPMAPECVEIVLMDFMALAILCVTVTI